MACCYLFLLIALFKDKGRPALSLDYGRSIMMDENLHYLTYSVAVMNVPKAFVLFAPQVLTCVIGMSRLYLYYQRYIPGILRLDFINHALRLVDAHSVDIFSVRAALEVAALIHMMLGMFMGLSNFIGLILYVNFIRVK
ncbi:uncharacterized protein BXIN_1794 [Babesia sp. Xinjiang]|nr:uncharacterized protein BXIN_1794 [Babesia sp. Xinjiang]ORM40996.1 hypothetical protein BXIN_1794 [Babesia sp. Xinjiang]